MVTMPLFLVANESVHPVVKINFVFCFPFFFFYSLTEYTEIVYDPDPKTSVIPEDQQLVQDHWDMAFLNPDSSTDSESLSPWVLRMVLNSAAVTVKGVLMEQIADTIRSRYNTDGDVIFADIYSDDNAPTLVRIQYHVFDCY